MNIKEHMKSKGIAVGNTVAVYIEGRIDGKEIGQVVELTEEKMVIRTRWTNDPYGHPTIPVLINVYGEDDDNGRNANVVVKKIA